MLSRDTPVAVVLCAVALAILIFCGIALGSIKIPVSEIDNILFSRESNREAWNTIVWQIRIPRTITAVLVGGSLGVAGLQMQTLFRNPVADSSILGVTAGATWGVALSVLIGAA
ncbi:MAG: iron chelate uptake ABC transporter family permease subunit, partial [Dehalococcoidia bacterium]|nr:iron chelate uptake ABC transporter family permease subunit [Dehalococcoidia bacterium]